LTKLCGWQKSIKNEYRKDLKKKTTEMVKRQEVSIFVEKEDNNLCVDINCPSKFYLKDTPNNRKLLYVLLRLVKSPFSTNLLTFQQISALFGFKSRQWSNNFYREFIECGQDFLGYLQRKKKNRAALPLIEQQFLNEPLLSLKEHYQFFIKENQNFKMSEQCFRNYVSQIDTVKYKKRIEEFTSKGKIEYNKDRFIKEILQEENTSEKSRKKIIRNFPELQPTEKETKREISFFQNTGKFSKYLLTMFLVASGLNYSILSIILGTCKSTIHNWFHYLGFLKQLILRSITWWSSEISTDEKWIKVNKKWHYVLSIVDNKTGFPLYFQVVDNLKKETWNIFFNRFYKLYGKPKLIISDGSEAIAGAIRQVFPEANHQLCKFHKLKNLTKKIYQYSYDKNKRKRMLRLANGIFKNKTYFGRKRAAKRLAEIGSKPIKRYVEKSILGKWDQLTKCYTSNSAERWNKKIEKCTQGRYGLKSLEFLNQLITSLWLKESIKDKRHFKKCIIHDLDMRKIRQENIKMSSIINFFKHNLLKRTG